MCSVLKISRSGYYSWRREKKFNKKRFELVVEIVEIHKESRGAYGSPRVYAELIARGFHVSKSTLERIMRKKSLRGKKRRRFDRTTNSNHNLPIALNIVDRVFDRNEKDLVWLSDITYIRKAEGFCYLAAIIDGHTRKIVGFSVADHMRESLVISAFNVL
jgi:transposase InsO family protein